MKPNQKLCWSSSEKGSRWKSPTFFHLEHCKNIQSSLLQKSHPWWVPSTMPLLGAPEVQCSWDALGHSEVHLVSDTSILLKVAIVALTPLFTCSSNSSFGFIEIWQHFLFWKLFQLSETFIPNSIKLLYVSVQQHWHSCRAVKWKYMMVIASKCFFSWKVKIQVLHISWLQVDGSASCRPVNSLFHKADVPGAQKYPFCFMLCHEFCPICAGSLQSFYTFVFLLLKPLWSHCITCNALVLPTQT